MIAKRFPFKLAALLVTLGLVVLLFPLLAFGYFVEGSDPSQSQASTITPSGQESTAITVQNICPRPCDPPAVVGAEYLDSQGSRVSLDIATVPSLYAKSFIQSSNAELPHGFRGGASIFADREVATVLTRFLANGNLVSHSAVSGFGSGSDRVFLAPVAKESKYGSSRLIVSNLSSTQTACVWAKYVNQAGTVAGAPLGGGASSSSTCPSGGRPIPPAGTLFVSADTGMPGNPGQEFVWALQLDSLPNKNNQKAMILASTDLWNGRRLQSYEGAPLDRLNINSTEDEFANTVVVPLVMETESWYTVLWIQDNDLSPSNGANVTIKYLSQTGGPCAPPGGCNSAISVWTWREVEPTNLPVGFIGSAIISSDRPVSVVALRYYTTSPTSSAYRGFTIDAASTRWNLPLLFRNYSSTGAQSWFQVQVADGGSAIVKVRYLKQDTTCPGGDFSGFVQRNIQGSDAFYLAGDDAWFNNSPPQCFSGSAEVTSDRPIVVIGTSIVGTAGGIRSGDLVGTYPATAP